ncbi:formyl transferase [Pararhizobium antarcticum]|uniref:phosphoribosylglycinamide formyltransferase 1 n=1 Tax=Pararhizobium antarcticum TaxID=1798805 RepID=A0A657LU09_9HYPH|nr:formyl transferase [Pararhizobium antarcticum]OJF91945.1 formyl transferase [Rhizobium sp. 58]OJF98328.1 formyl transferase [Pararhizobium antarcticum]
MRDNTASGPRIVVVTAGGANPQIMINALASRFGTEAITVVQEEPESKSVFLRRRARKLGWIAAAGQFATMVVSKVGKRFTHLRAVEILRDYGVSDEQNPAIAVLPISSINEASAAARICDLAPDVVFLISCRMLSRATLSALPCPVLNFHAGINPHYRGLMGGYWALASGDAANFGATVHLVDAGVDTGDVLYQSRMTPSKRDTLHTYPLLQTAASTDIAIRAIEDVLDGAIRPVATSGPSKQWYHPPIWTWLWNGIARRIW